MIASKLTRAQANELYAQVLRDRDVATLRRLCMEDLFFLLTVACKRKDINRDWLYARCREVEGSPNGHLDLWAREHYKSTIITYGKTIQDILVNPSVTVGIFSHTRPIAKAFLKQIKTELETNEFLKGLFPDVLWSNPQKEAPAWSLDGGITVKRPTNPKECTVEAWGLVDGQPISKHYSLLVYDDVVTGDSVTTPDMIEKTTQAWGLSLSLGAAGGKRRYIGTRYHFNDTYRTIGERGAAIERRHAATVDGTPNGDPVFMDRETLAERRMGGPYVFACQYLQNPVADDAQGFKTDWLRWYENQPTAIGQMNGPPRGMNIFLLVDPAGEKKKENDYTVMAVIGLGPDGNYYLLDGIRDRLNLTERTDRVFELQRKWKPIKTVYEKYGLQSDIEHIQYVQNHANYRFEIVPIGGQIPKNDRIRKLIPVFEQGRFYMPRRLMFVDREGKARDFVAELLRDEFSAFPVAVHDDMMDCLSRIVDSSLGAVFPKEQTVQPHRMKTNSTYKVL